MYVARAERTPNTYRPVNGIVVPAGTGRIVQLESSHDGTVRTMHAEVTEFASLVERCA